MRYAPNPLRHDPWPAGIDPPVFGLNAQPKAGCAQRSDPAPCAGANHVPELWPKAVGGVILQGGAGNMPVSYRAIRGRLAVVSHRTSG